MQGGKLTKLKIRYKVLFAGNQKDVVPWLQSFDVFALPSYANEGVPQALLQAMLVGAPCVTTAAGAIPEIARDGDTARIVAAEDADALAAGIDALIDAPGAAAEQASRARAFVLPRFGLDTMLDRMEVVFRRAIVEHAGATREVR